MALGDQIDEFLKQTKPGPKREVTLADQMEAFLAQTAGGPDKDGVPKSVPREMLPTTPNVMSRSALKAFGASVAHGLLYPVGSFMPELYTDLGAVAEQSRRTMSSQMTERNIADENVRDLLTSVPVMAGELVGSAIPGVGTYGAFRTLAGVGKAKTLLESVGRTAAAGVAQGTTFSLAAHLEEGESRAMRIARDTAMAGAFEFIGIPFVRKAWFEELGETVSKEVAGSIAAARGTDIESAMRTVDAIRGGASADVEVAETMLRELEAKDPKLLKSAPAVAAARVMQAWTNGVIGSQTIDPALKVADPNFGIAFTIVENGAEPRPVHIPSRKGDVPMTITGKEVSTTEWATAMAAIRQEIFEKRARALTNPALDTKIQITDIRAADKATITRLVNYMYGKKSSGAAPLKAKEIFDAMGAARAGTIAETGDLGAAAVGKEVTFMQPGQVPVTATIVSDDAAGPGFVDMADRELKQGAYTPAGTTVSGRPVAPEVRASQPQGANNVPATPKVSEPSVPSVPSAVAKPRPTDFDRESLPPVAVERDAWTGMATIEYVDTLTKRKVRKQAPLGQLVAKVQVQELGGKPIPKLRLQAHPDGSARRGYISIADENTDGAIGIEPVGFKGGEYFRSSAFDEIDPDDTTVGMMPRFYVGKDGSVSFSVAAHTEISTQKSYGRVQDVGPYDSIRAMVQQDPREVALQQAEEYAQVEAIRKVPLHRRARLKAQLAKRATKEDGTLRGLYVSRAKEQSTIEKTPLIEGYGKNRKVSSVWEVSKSFHAEGYDTSFSGFPGNPSPRYATIDPVTKALVWKTEPRTTYFVNPKTGKRYPVKKINPQWRDTPDEVLAKSTFPAGYTPKKAAFVGEATETIDTIPAIRRSDAPPESAKTRVGATADDGFQDDGFRATRADSRAESNAAPGGRRIVSDERIVQTGPEYLIPAGVKQSATDPTVRIDPNSLRVSGFQAWSPELVAASKAARILLKRGVDPATKSSIFVAQRQHRNIAGRGDRVWTLGDLASYKPEAPPLRVIMDEAGHRGWRPTPIGGKMSLARTDGSQRKVFDNWAEAYEFITREPIGQAYTPKLEADVEALFGMGFERRFDPEVDGGTFRGKQLAESSVNEVISGKRPGTVVRSASPNFPLVMDAVRSAQPQAVASVIRAVDLGEAAGAITKYGKKGEKLVTKQWFVYNDVAVTQLLRSNGHLLRGLGLKAGNQEELIKQLADMPEGLSMLMGRNPSHAAAYTALRKKMARESWELGPVKYDSVGAYRDYTGLEQTIMPRAFGVAGGSEGAPATVFTPEMAGRDMADFIPPPHEPIPPDAFDEIVPPGYNPYDDDEMKAMIINDPRGARITDVLRVPGELFKDIEDKVGIPMYDWFRGIEEGRAAVEAATKTAYGELDQLLRTIPKSDRQMTQLLLESKFHTGYDALKAQATPDQITAASSLEAIWRKWYDTEVAPHPEYHKDGFEAFMRQLPDIRLKGEEKKVRVWRGDQAVPPSSLKSGKFSSVALASSERDFDAASVARRIMHATANDIHLSEPWQHVTTRMKAFEAARTDDPKAIDHYFRIFSKYMAEVAHNSDEWNNRIAMTVNRVTKAVLGKNFEVDETFDLVSTLTSTNYYANLSFSLGATMRNYMQTLQTVFPVMGADATYAGIRKAVAWKRSMAIQDDMIHRGVISRDAFVEPFRDMQRWVLETKSLQKHAKTSAKVMDLLDYGIQMYQSADNFNRVAAYEAKMHVALPAAKAFTEGKSTWADFLSKSKAIFQDSSENGPLLGAVKKAMADGRADTAAHLLALDFSRATQFVYTRGNGPYIMQGTLGRLFLQYGAWPSWYVEWMRNHMMLRRGSAKDNLAVIGRFMAVNSAMYYGASQAFGVDFARWTFFAPLSYRGGPMLDLASGAHRVASATIAGEGEIQKDPESPLGVDFVPSDPVTRVTKQRLAMQASKQLLPLPINAGSQWLAAYEEYQKDDVPAAMKRLLGLPEVKK